MHGFLREPAPASTWQSDVEASHKLIEDEFYDIKDYEELEDFRAKSYAYGLYFNFKRPNRYRGRKTPVEILEESGSGISPQVFNLPPLILDNYLDCFTEGGYHVGSSARFYTPPKFTPGVDKRGRGPYNKGMNGLGVFIGKLGHNLPRILKDRGFMRGLKERDSDEKSPLDKSSKISIMSNMRGKEIRD